MIRNLSLVSLSVLGLCACTSTPTSRLSTLPQITYDHLNVIPVNVATLNIDTNVIRGAQAWDITDTLTTPPDLAMQRYLQSRFKANGADGELNLSLTKADIRVDSVPNENTFLSWFSLANNEDYTIEIIVNLDKKYVSGDPDMTKTTRFVRKTKLPVNATIAYREARLQQALEYMVSDIDTAIITTLSNEFNVIASRYVPTQNIDIKTQLPETESKVGVFWKDVKTGIAKTTNDVSDALFSPKDNSAIEVPEDTTVTTTPKPITPQAN